MANAGVIAAVSDMESFVRPAFSVGLCGRALFGWQ